MIFITRSLWLVLLAAGTAAQAADNMQFSGALMEAPPCIINDKQEIKVAFGGQVLSAKINGVNYRKPLPYTLNCGNPGATYGGVVITLRGLASGFDRTALQTNIEGLGIRILQSGEPLEIGRLVKVIDTNNPPIFEAVLVKAENVKLQDGPFAATATLLAYYQ